MPDRRAIHDADALSDRLKGHQSGARSIHLEPDVCDFSLRNCGEGKSTSLEHLQHLHVLPQNFCDQLLEFGCLGDNGKMTKQYRADAFPLVLVDHDESDLSLSRRHDDITSTANDNPSACFFYQRDQCHMLVEVNVQKE